MNQTFIYTLSDYNGVVRYIGKTDNPKRRLREHLYESKKNPKIKQHVRKNGMKKYIHI